jgi:hypothetical protein
MRKTKLLLGTVLAAIIVGGGLGVTHYVADRQIRRALKHAQETLPPGDSLTYKHLSTGLIGRTLVFTDLKIKHGLEVAAADRLTLHGIGNRAITSAEAENLRIAQGLDVLNEHHVSIRHLYAPKPFDEMTRADWPLVQIGQLKIRDVDGGYIRNSRPGSITLNELTIDHYGDPHHDHLDMRGLNIQGGPNDFGGLRVGHVAADNPNLEMTAEWLNRGNIADMSGLNWERHTGETNIENLSVGPVAAPIVSMKQVHMVMNRPHDNGPSHSVLDITDWESRSPQVLAFLTSLGYADNKFIRADLSVTGDYNPATQSFSVSPLKIDVAGMASASLMLNMDQWPVLNGMPAPAAFLNVRLQGLALTYHDASLFDHLCAFIARERGVSAGQVQAGMRDDLAKLAASGVPEAASAAQALTSFIQKPGTLDITVNPPQPVALSLLALSLTNQANALQALNVNVKAH